jgi:hypothetical protein
MTFLKLYFIICKWGNDNEKELANTLYSMYYSGHFCKISVYAELLDLAS